MKILLVVACVAVFAVGCSSDAEQASVEQPLTPEQELQAWAAGVCTASDELRGTVGGIASSLDIDITAGLDQLPQVYEQLQASLNEVDLGIQAVQSAVAQVPASTPEAVVFADELEGLVVSTRTSGQQALTAAQEALNADNFLTAGVSAAQAVAAGRTAYDDAQRAITLVDDARTNGQGPVGEAFANAPECQSAS